MVKDKYTYLWEFFLNVMGYFNTISSYNIFTQQNDYVTAAHAIGASNLRVMFRHIAPNCFPPLIVLMTMQIGYAILAEAGLSFLGVGLKPPAAAWGAMEE